MRKRELYLLNQSTSTVLERIDVTGWSVNRILELERKLSKQASRSEEHTSELQSH